MYSFRSGKFDIGNDKVPDDINIRSLTPISRESCFALGFTAQDLLGPDSAQNPHYKEGHSVEEQELLRGDHTQRLTKLQEQCDKLIKERMHSRRNRGPRGVTDQEFYVRIIEERKNVTKMENSKKKVLHNTQLRNAENYRQAQIREHVRQRQRQDKPIIETAVKDDVVNAYSKTFSHGILQRSGAVNDAKYDYNNRQSGKYRYERQLEHGAFPILRGSTSPNNNSNNNSVVKESKKQLFTRLYAPSDPNQAKDVDLDIELATYRANMLRTEQSEKMHVRADEHANRLLYAKKQKQQEHETRVQKLVDKYKKSNQYNRAQEEDREEQVRQMKQEHLQTHHHVQDRNEEFHKGRQTYRQVLKHRTSQKQMDAERLRLALLEKQLDKNKTHERYTHVQETQQQLAEEAAKKREDVGVEVQSKLSKAEGVRIQLAEEHKQKQHAEQEMYEDRKYDVFLRNMAAEGLLENKRDAFTARQERSLVQMAETRAKQQEKQNAYTKKRNLRREQYESRMSQKQKIEEYNLQASEHKLAQERDTREKNRQLSETVRVERERLLAHSKHRQARLGKSVEQISRTHRLGQIDSESLGHPDDQSEFLIQRSAGLK